MTRGYHRRSTARSQGPWGRGFTLLELLVVVTILALLVAVVPPLVSGAIPGAELKSATREIAAALRYARSQAITHGQDVTLHLDVKSRRYRITGARREFALPADLDISVYGAASASSDSVTGGIRFFSDGSSTGGRIKVASTGRAYQVDVDWLLGRVQIRD